MDRSKQLSGRCRCSVIVGWVALLLTGGCGAGAQEEHPHHIDVTVAPTVSLEEGIEMLGSSDAEFVREQITANARPADELAALPPHAIAAGHWGAGEFDEPPRRPSELVVVNFWPTRMRMNVLCMVDGIQVACSDDAGVWRVELDAPGLAVVDLPESDARRDVILAEERDQMVQRPIPVSSARPVDGWDVAFSTLDDPPPTITNPFGGCDWALLLDNLDAANTFNPLRVKGIGAVYLVISTCPDTASHEMRPIVLLDETTVAQIDEFKPFVAQPGTTYALRIPDELFEGAHTIRGSVIRRARGEGRWTTHPLATAA